MNRGRARRLPQLALSHSGSQHGTWRNPTSILERTTQRPSKVQNKIYKITFKSTGANPPDTIKQILKTKINPGEIKVGIRTFKSFSGGVLIETNSKEEIEILGKEIQAKCGRELEARLHSLRKPRLIILNVPGDIKTRYRGFNP